MLSKRRLRRSRFCGSFGGVFAIFLRHFPSLRFMNTAAMAESVSALTKHKFLVLDPTKEVETFCKFSLRWPNTVLVDAFADTV